MSDVAKIASGLSDSMKDALLASHLVRLGSESRRVSRYLGERTRKALAFRGLVFGGLLTESGLAVRAHLLENRDG